MRLRPSLLLLIAALVAAIAPPANAADDERFVVVRAGRIVTISGEEIENGEIVIVDGVIRLVGKGLEYPADAEVIDASDLTVMPGWIDPASRHGVPGYERSGTNGSDRVLDEVDPGSIDFEPMLAAGYTAAGLYLPGENMPGVSAAVRTARPADAPARAQVLRRTSWLRLVMGDGGRDKAALRSALQKAQGELDKISKAKAEWEAKKAEAEKKAAEAPKAEGGDGDGDGEKKADEGPGEFKAPRTDASVQPLMDWLEGKLTLRPVIQVTSAGGLLHLDEVLDAHEDLEAHLILGGRVGGGGRGRFRGFGGSGDFSPAVDALASRGAIVVTEIDTTTLPSSSIRFNLPAALAHAGADVAFVPTTPSTAPGTDDATGELRSLRSRLAMVLRMGMPRDAALRAVTIVPARLLGVDARVGTIEAGKDADLVFLDGDALDPLATVEKVMILGEIVWENDQ